MLQKKIAYLFFSLAAIIYLLIEARGDGDLYIYLQAAGKLQEGADIYSIKYIHSQYQYYYSVLFAWLLIPFHHLPYYGVKLGWIALNFGLALHLLFMLKQSKALEMLPDKHQQWCVGITALYAFRFVHENIHASQITILILWCCVQGLFHAEKGNVKRAAIFLAIGINIKLLPLLVLPYLVYRGFFKSTLYTILALSLSFLLPALLIGLDYNTQLLQSWWQQINPDQVRHVLDTDERSFHGLSTLLATLLVKNVYDPLAMDLRRNIFDLPYETVQVILTLSRVGFLTFTLFFVRRLPFKKVEVAELTVGEKAYLLALVPLLFPHQQHYAFLFTVPAFAVVVYRYFTDYHTWSGAKRIIMLTGLGCVYLCGNLKILLGEYNRYYEHYKILTYGALLLLFLLANSRKSLANRFASLS